MKDFQLIEPILIFIENNDDICDIQIILFLPLIPRSSINWEVCL